MRLVLDTNILVSASLSPLGAPRRLLDGARNGEFELCSSAALLAELIDVLSRERFAARFAAAGIAAPDIVKDIRRIATMAHPTSVPRVILNDPDDDQVLACALAAQADLIVSGDKHLHSLGGSYQGVAIVRPAEAVTMIESP